MPQARTTASSTARRARATPPAATPAAAQRPTQTAAQSQAKVKVTAATAKQPKAKSSSQPKVQPATQAKRAAVAKAKALAPNVPARIGSTPATTYRGNPDIFGRLVEDHDRHRALLAMIAETQSSCAERERLFHELTLELKSHANAEEQALWATVMRNPETTDDARHAVSEHKDIDDMLADLAARDMASPAWMRRFKALREAYLHHIQEEEQEQFVAAEPHLSATDIRHMRQVFNQRKKGEKATVVVEKKIKLK